MGLMTRPFVNVLRAFCLVLFFSLSGPMTYGVGNGPCLTTATGPLSSFQIQPLEAANTAAAAVVQSETPPEENIESFDGIVKKFSENPSDHDSPQLRKAALAAMKGAFRYHNFPEPTLSEGDWKFEAQFKKKMLDLWVSFSQGFDPESDPSYRYLTLFRKDHYVAEIKADVRKAFSHGIIPIPNFGHGEHYTYTSLRKYFALGIYPVEIDRYEKGATALRNEHPMSPEFLSTSLALIEHDMQHADLIGTIFETFGLDSVKERLEFMRCIQSVPEESERNSVNRKAIYYLMHEDPIPFAAGQLQNEDYFRALTTTNYVEFALERSISKKDLSLSSLFQGKTQLSEPHRKSACLALDYMRLKNKIPDDLFSVLIPRLEFTEKLRRFLVIKNDRVIPLSKTVYFEIQMGIVNKMLAQCVDLITFDSRRAPTNPDPKLIREGYDILKKNFDEAETPTKKKFSSVFFDELESLHDGVNNVMAHLGSSNDASCHPFLFPQPLNLSPEELVSFEPKWESYLHNLRDSIHKSFVARDFQTVLDMVRLTLHPEIRKAVDEELTHPSTNQEENDPAYQKLVSLIVGKKAK